jgi:hypothetical protein
MTFWYYIALNNILSIWNGSLNIREYVSMTINCHIRYSYFANQIVISKAY